MIRYYLRFIKGGMDDFERITVLGESRAFEVIRDRLGMGWILVSCEVE